MWFRNELSSLAEVSMLCTRADSHCVTFPFRHRSVFVPSERSVFTLSAMFSRLPEQHLIGGLRLFPSDMQPSATECVFRYLLIIRSSVMIELIVTSKCAIKKKHWNLPHFFNSSPICPHNFSFHILSLYFLRGPSQKKRTERNTYRIEHQMCGKVL